MELRLHQIIKNGIKYRKYTNPSMSLLHISWEEEGYTYELTATIPPVIEDGLKYKIYTCNRLTTILKNYEVITYNKYIK